MHNRIDTELSILVCLLHPVIPLFPHQATMRPSSNKRVRWMQAWETVETGEASSSTISCAPTAVVEAEAIRDPAVQADAGALTPPSTIRASAPTTIVEMEPLPSAPALQAVAGAPTPSSIVHAGVPTTVVEMDSSQELSTETGS